MAFDLSSLEASVGALERALKVTADAARYGQLPLDVREAVRAGVIQGFEVAYEQSWKMMRRWLESNAAYGDASGASMRQIYRMAAKAGLINDVDRWMAFHQARNQTSHTYNPKTAEAVFGLSAAFLPEALAALAAIRARND